MLWIFSLRRPSPSSLGTEQGGESPYLSTDCSTAYALIREDIDQANIQRTDLVAQAIHLLMESARVGLKQNNPGAVVGAVAQLDKLCGLGIRK